MSISNQRGAVLLLVLVVVALLSALLTDWAFSTLVDMRLTETFRDSNRAYYLARGGVEVGRQLLWMDNNQYDTSTEMWGVGVPSYPVSDEATVSISIVDEDGRFDLNQVAGSASVSMRPRFFQLLKNLAINDPDKLSDALIDWIDSNQSPSPYGAEDSWYQSLTPPMTCKNKALDTVDELLLIKGFTPEIVQRLAPFVTVAEVSNLNLNTVSKELLLAWDYPDFNATAVEQLLAAREKKPFVKNQDVIDAVGSISFSALNRYNSGLAYKSDYYRITSVAQVNDGVRTVEALMKKNNLGIHQLWRRVY